MSSNDPRYQRAHWLVWKERGPASGYACVVCGESAAHWAYSHQSPKELTSREGWPYSENVEDYEPLCMKCHRARDMARWSPQLREDVKAKQSRSSRKQSLVKAKCLDCGMTTNRGNLGRHQRSSGHTGREILT